MTRSPNARKIALVTGGAFGIGRAAALALARAGYRLAILDIDEAGARAVLERARTADGDGVALCVDVRSQRSVRDAFATVVAELGEPFALVNAAGVMTSVPTVKLSLEEWRRIIDVNLTGTFLCCREMARTLTTSTSAGRIVNIASVHSYAPSAGLAHYDASKGGVWMLTRSLALELGPVGITVNAVAPGYIAGTRMTEGTSAEYLDRVLPGLPLRRAGSPEDVAGAVAFLCSDSAAYITGTAIVVDGGMLLTAQT